MRTLSTRVPRVTLAAIALTSTTAVRAEGLILEVRHAAGSVTLFPGQTVSGELILVANNNAPAFQVFGSWNLQAQRNGPPYPIAPSPLLVTSIDPSFTVTPVSPGYVAFSFDGTFAGQSPGRVIGTWSWTPTPDLVGGQYVLFPGPTFQGEYRRDGAVLPYHGAGVGSNAFTVIPAAPTTALLGIGTVGLATARRRR
jgi:hypothetical protein